MEGDAAGREDDGDADEDEVDGDKDESTWMIRRISCRAAVELKSVGNTIPAALIGKDAMASNASR